MFSHGNVSTILLDKPMRLYESLKMFHSRRSGPARVGTVGSAGQGLEGAAVLPVSSTCLFPQPGPRRGEAWGRPQGEAGVTEWVQK